MYTPVWHPVEHGFFKPISGKLYQSNIISFAPVDWLRR
jgi:hypothetical protein